MDNLILVFRSLKGCCHGNEYLVAEPGGLTPGFGLYLVTAFSLTSSIGEVTERLYQFLEMVEVELDVDNERVCRIVKRSHVLVVGSKQIRMQSLFTI